MQRSTKTTMPLTMANHHQFWVPARVPPAVHSSLCTEYQAAYCDISYTDVIWMPLAQCHESSREPLTVDEPGFHDGSTYHWLVIIFHLKNISPLGAIIPRYA